MSFPIEDIPDSALLYLRVHKNHIDDEGEVNVGVFKEHGEGNKKSMSTDWKNYSTPEDTRNRARKPNLNGVVHFIARNLRNLTLSVTHSPIDPNPPVEEANQAHTDVNGNNKPIEEDGEIRLKLLDEIEWDIRIDMNKYSEK